MTSKKRKKILILGTGFAAFSLLKKLDTRLYDTTIVSPRNYFYLQVPSNPDIYAIGDCAALQHQELPATAQVAQQMGRYLGNALNRQATGERVKPFAFKYLGMLAYLGGRKALADLPTLKGGGFTTWLFWRSAYLTKLVSFN